ncbi:MAG: hypothetical protein DMG73_08825 [Acidobacteria bacterium]|nr:MAG: hypothetical protein DMG73_08825 [Acidobacteriota bacterium]
MEQSLVTEQSLAGWKQYKGRASRFPEGVVKDGASHRCQTFHLAGKTDRPMLDLLRVGMRVIVRGVIGTSLVFLRACTTERTEAARGGGKV